VGVIIGGQKLRRWCRRVINKAKKLQATEVGDDLGFLEKIVASGNLDWKLMAWVRLTSVVEGFGCCGIVCDMSGGRNGGRRVARHGCSRGARQDAAKNA